MCLKAPVFSSQQVTSAHEFGYAMGMPHVRCAGDGVCYGINQAEYTRMMVAACP